MQKCFVGRGKNWGRLLIVCKSRITAWVFLVCCVILLPGSVAAQQNKNGRRLYLTYCSGCHGTSGKGNGPAAKMLPVKPADHTRGVVMNRLSDKYLFQVISQGGKKVGKSANMPAWGAVLKPRQIEDIIAYIRILAGSASAEAEGNAK